MASCIRQEEPALYLFSVLAFLHVVELVVLDFSIASQRRFPGDSNGGGWAGVRSDIGCWTRKLNWNVSTELLVAKSNHLHCQ